MRVFSQRQNCGISFSHWGLSFTWPWRSWTWFSLYRESNFDLVICNLAITTYPDWTREATAVRPD